MAEDLKPKTPEQVVIIKQAIEEKFRQRYATIVEIETKHIPQLIRKLTTLPKLEALLNKVVLQ